MCQVWHSVTSEAPPQPFRPIGSKIQELKTCGVDRLTPGKFHDAFKQLRIERASFKNMQIHLADCSIWQSVLNGAHSEGNPKSQFLRRSEDEREWNRSTMSFEYSESRDLASTTDLSSPTLTHKIINNYQHIPMGVSKQVLGLIADEVGLKISELSSTTRFEEIGLDSLLSLSIINQLRKDGLTLPTSIFWDFPTVEELESFLDRP